MGRVKNESEKLTFNQLLSKYIVEIPIIQRDYAQGRKSKSTLRKSFLLAIKNGILGEPIELDFIYGDLTGETFQPLDGQQRLTTLFLLYWYAAIREKKSPTNNQFLQKFTYKTRISSRDFCRDLSLSRLNLSLYDLPSKAIKDSEWYSLSWDRDPTVSGMLQTLDDISRQFSEIEDLWGELNKDVNPPISFHCVVLDDFGLSDDLYIKMNARGKPLTDFENFKALFERRIKSEGWDTHRPRQEHFDILVDTTWIDLFWKQFVIADYENANPLWRKFQPSAVDDALLRFFENSQALTLSLSDESESEEARLLLNRAGSLEVSSVSEDTYRYLYERLQAYGAISPDLLDVTFGWHRLLGKEESILRSICGRSSPSFAQRLLFFAQAEFLMSAQVPFDSSNYQDWMRVVRNIVRNSSIENYVSFRGALTFFKELSAGCQNIYEFLHSAEIKSRFARDQVKEEVTKAGLILSDPDGSFKRVLHDLEDTYFCEGNLSLPLRYARDPKGAVIQPSRLREALAIIDRYFQYDIGDLIRRALLTLNQPDFFRYWNSWLYATECPKYRLIENFEDMRTFLKSGELLGPFNELFDQLKNQTPDQIIEKFEPTESTPSWRKMLIKEAKWLGLSKKKYIAFDDSWDHCYLMEGSKVTNDDAGRKRLTKIPGEVEVEQ
jgi:hypothetical protein